MERAKTRLERGLPAQAPKKPKVAKPRHDGYVTLPRDEHVNGAECPYPGCGLPVFSRATKDTVRPCPLGRGCDDIPRRFT